MSHNKSSIPLTKSSLLRLLGPFLFVAILFVPHGSVNEISWRVLALAVWMLTWWLTETVHLAVTALLPLVVLPLLGVLPLKEVAPNYANPMVYLFFGGFVLALAIEKWHLHRRIALNIIRLTGSSTMRVFLGLMLATAFISMWISNTATTVMMLPIAISILELLDPAKKTKLGALLMIGLAWSANIGGIATLIGTPPNLVFAGFMKEQLGREVFFSEWLMYGLPTSVLLLVGAFFVLKILVPKKDQQNASAETEAMIADELKKLGPMGAGEKRVLLVFVITALAWIFRQQLVQLTGWQELSDTTIALLSALFLFALPADKTSGKRILEWSDTHRLEWGILILFGGGLALAEAIQASEWIGLIGFQITSLNLTSMLLLTFIIAVLGIFLTEIISNLALVTALLPLVAALAVGSHSDAFALSLTLTLGASCAFMLPMATPPNAIVFASGHFSVATMARYGFIMNIISVAVVTLVVYLLG